MADPPPGSYVAISVRVTSFLDTSVLTACAEKFGGGWVCWQSRGVYWWTGDEEERVWEIDGPLHYSDSWTGIDEAEIWGELSVMTTPDPSPGRYIRMSSSGDYTCALTQAGEPRLLGGSAQRGAPSPPPARPLRRGKRRQRPHLRAHRRRRGRLLGLEQLGADRGAPGAVHGHQRRRVPHVRAYGSSRGGLLGRSSGYPPEGRYKAVSTGWHEYGAALVP